MSDPAEGIQELDEGVRAAFRRHILRLADSKRLLGIRYSDWILGAPSIEAGIAASAMAQDEWGHARLLYAALKPFGDDPLVVEHERPAAEYASMEPLDEPLADWAEVTAAIVMLDGALTVALDAVRGGSYGVLEGRIGKMLAEEEFHRSLGEGWFRRLARGSEEARETLRGSAARMLPVALRYLGPEDEAHALVAGAGLTLEAGELRGRLGGRLSPLLELVEIEIPADAPSMEDWDDARGRGPGHPTEEAVERARGDRNRALFVE